MQQWELAHDRQFFAAAAGRSAEHTVWSQSLWQEWAQDKKMVSLSSLLDMRKAYERISHRRLGREAKAVKANLVLLRVSISIYSGPRRCRYHQCHSRAIVTECSIIAGCGFATGWLKVFFLRVMDTVMEKYYCLMLRVYVDDITMTVIGTQRFVARVAPDALALLLRLLERWLGFVINEDKSYINARELKLGTWIAKRLGTRRFQQARAVRNLGVDFAAAGARRATAVWNQQLKQVRQRQGRIKGLRQAGGGQRSKYLRLAWEPS